MFDSRVILDEKRYVAIMAIPGRRHTNRREKFGSDNQEKRSRQAFL